MYYTHGLARDGKRHPLYSLWNNVKNRCYNEKNQDYIYYGARGIAMCWGWKEDFMNFYLWAIENGWKKGLQLDRKENSEGYYPWNCRFISGKGNCNNRRNSKILTIFGETKTMAEWARDNRCQVKYVTFALRMWKRNWTPEEALTTPLGQERIHKLLKKGIHEDHGKQRKC